MTSFITSIYDDIEGMTVSYTDKNGSSATANCLNVDEYSASLQTADLPARVLLLNNQTSGTLYRGAGIDANWSITDLFLAETAARSTDAEMNPVLLRYQAAYLDALYKKWQLIHTYNTEIETLSYTTRAGKFEYPAGSGVYFYGCEFVIEINERI